MKKLSMAAVQERLVEADLAKKARYETMKKNGTRLHAVSSLNDPSTKITNIKQVSMPKELERKSGTHAPFVKQAEMAGVYVDKMDRGVFEKDSSDGAPRSTPSVTKMKPNQTNRQTRVNPDMQKGSRKSEGSANTQMWPAAEMAGHYVDALPRGNIYSKENMGSEVKAPSAKNLHGTTRPKSSRKTANLTRHPMDHQPSVGEPGHDYPMPKDAPPKKRPYEHVKSGVLVRVNESVKAKFDIVSTRVLRRMMENYKRFGYRVVVEHSRQAPKWKSDPTFMRLLHETVAAKQNQSDALYRQMGGRALSRLYQLCQTDYNNLYESRDAFLKTLRIAFGKILEHATFNYRKSLNLYIGKARVMAEGATNDVEILAEGQNHQMALRLIRNKLFEQFGLDTNIKFIFIDGTKYAPEQIREWIPTLVRTGKAA